MNDCYLYEWLVACKNDCVRGICIHLNTKPQYKVWLVVAINISMRRLSYNLISGGTQRGFYKQAKGDYLNRVNLDQMVLEIVRWEGWAAWVVAKKQIKGGHQARVHSDKVVLVMARQRSWTAMRAKSQGGLSGSSALRSDGFNVSQAGRLDCVTVAKDAQERAGKHLLEAKRPTKKQA
jgi:hypothetical protein